MIRGSTAFNGGRYARSGVFAFLCMLGAVYFPLVAQAKSSHVSRPQLFAQSAQSGDPHRFLLGPGAMELFERSMRQEYQGIGVRMVSARPEGARISEVFAGSPADLAGLSIGDHIVGVGGKDVSRWSLNKIFSAVRGLPGSSVQLDILRSSSGELEQLTIQRQLVEFKTVSDPIHLTEAVSYVRIRQFAEKTHEEFVASMAPVMTRQKPSLVIDLRGNAGGLLESALEILDDFFEQKSLMLKVKDVRRKRSQFHRATSEAPFSGLDVVVLVDRNTASASEVLAGAMQVKNRAVLIGEKTFGKGTIQSIYAFESGEGVRMTTGEFFLPDGRRIAGLGLKPDIELKFSHASIAELSREALREDSAVSKALEYFDGSVR